MKQSFYRFREDLVRHSFIKVSFDLCRIIVLRLSIWRLLLSSIPYFENTEFRNLTYFQGWLFSEFR